MKKTFLTFITSVALSASLWAQAPQAFNYQGVARDLSGTALATKNISVKASILDGSLTGTVVYSETHAIATNQFGLFTLAIGTGTVASGTFASTNWASGNKYLKIEIDPNGGSSYSLSGTTQLLSVPYAMYAASSGDSKWSDNSVGINYNGGKVGIGTSNPQFPMEISGNFEGNDRNQIYLRNTNATQSSASGIAFISDITDGGLQIFSNSYFPTGLPFLTGRMRMYSRSANGILLEAENTVTGNIEFAVGTKTIIPGSNIQTSVKMIVASNGNVGIGTTTPKAKLQITSGDVYLDDATKGIIMKNTSGQCYRITVGTAGALVSTLITCP